MGRREIQLSTANHGTYHIITSGQHFQNESLCQCKNGFFLSLFDNNKKKGMKLKSYKVSDCFIEREYIFWQNVCLLKALIGKKKLTDIFQAYQENTIPKICSRPVCRLKHTMAGLTLCIRVVTDRLHACQSSYRWAVIKSATNAVGLHYYHDHCYDCCLPFKEREFRIIYNFLR